VLVTGHGESKTKADGALHVLCVRNKNNCTPQSKTDTDQRGTPLPSSSSSSSAAGASSSAGASAGFAIGAMDTRLAWHSGVQTSLDPEIPQRQVQVPV
jgi:hypothetical protein